MKQRVKYAGANWVQGNLTYILAIQAKKKKKGERTALPESPQLSEFAKEVAEILGQVYRGIYHIEESVYATDWLNPFFIQVPSVPPLATWDASDLTGLVILCHDRGIRCTVMPHTFNTLKLGFSQRSVRQGDYSIMHPTMETAIEAVRADRGLGIKELPETLP